MLITPSKQLVYGGYGANNGQQNYGSSVMVQDWIDVERVRLEV